MKVTFSTSTPKNFQKYWTGKKFFANQILVQNVVIIIVIFIG